MGADACSEKMDEPELGYWLGRDYWGKGYATEAGRRVIRHAFEDLGSKAVWCCYYEGNERSKRVQEKLGFSYVRRDPEGDTLLGYTLPEILNVLTFRRKEPEHEHCR
jgi:RimJ/RimL family protein N-acetyltransferase